MKNKIWEKRFIEERKLRKSIEEDLGKCKEKVSYAEKYAKFLIDKLAEFSQWMIDENDQMKCNEQAFGMLMRCQQKFEEIFEQKKQKDKALA